MFKVYFDDIHNFFIKVDLLGNLSKKINMNNAKEKKFN